MASNKEKLSRYDTYQAEKAIMSTDAFVTALLATLERDMDHFDAAPPANTTEIRTSLHLLRYTPNHSLLYLRPLTPTTCGVVFWTPQQGAIVGVADPFANIDYSVCCTDEATFRVDETDTACTLARRLEEYFFFCAEQRGSVPIRSTPRPAVYRSFGSCFG